MKGFPARREEMALTIGYCPYWNSKLNPSRASSLGALFVSPRPKGLYENMRGPASGPKGAMKKTFLSGLWILRDN
jgi:hypothetical protein